jgi:nucleoid-associated protein YgaU
MDPALALPSYRVYRGSLLALLMGSVVAVWLLVLPPAGADQDGPPGSIAAIVPTATPTAEATPDPEATPPAEATPAIPLPTPSPAETPEPEPTPTPQPETITYTVQPGDTLLGIAEQYATGFEAVQAMADRIAEENGITDPSALAVGQELTIPQ